MVTGATSGIGRRQAMALANAGATIVAVGRDSQQLDATLSKIEGQGVAIAADLLTVDCGDLIADAVAKAGPIDILCNTAA